MRKWFNFKLSSSIMLLIITTVYSITSENTYGYDIWFCIWALCVVRFVDALDDIGSENDKN